MSAAKKIYMSESLGQKLKEFRLQYGIKNKDLATYINKSTAYVSKLERGQIKQISRGDLVSITNFISGSEKGYDLFCEMILSSSSSEDLDHDVAFLNFDMINRRIPITKECVALLQSEFQKTSISYDELASLINSNSDLDENFYRDHCIDKNSIRHNIWHSYQEADSLEIQRSYIYIDYPLSAIVDIMTGKTTKCEYMLPFVILYHLYKQQCQNTQGTLTDKDNNNCKNQAEEQLALAGIYSLAVKKRLLEKASNPDEYLSYLSSSDMDNHKLISSLLDSISTLSAYDVEYTNRKLQAIVNNLQNGDLSFSITYMAAPINKLKDLNTSSKKQFLDELSSLIKKYTDIVNSSDNIELF